MENKPLVFALGLFGIGLLAASMVGVVYITKLEDLQRRPLARVSDWSVLSRFEGRSVRTGGVEFVVTKAYVGEEVNPVLREPVRAECQDAIVLRLKVRNLEPGAVTITPGVFRLEGATKGAARPIHREGFERPTLAPGEERAYQVGFAAITNTLPCVLRIEGDTLRAGGEADGLAFDGLIDVCPAIF